MNFLDEDELELAESFENEEWKSSKNLEEQKNVYAQYAKATLKKDKRVNIRITERDLSELQRKAIKDGLPYQTLIASILHRYVNGSLKESTI